MDGMQNDLSQKIDNLQYSISRLTNLNIVQEKGKFPSQPHQNPKGIHEVEAQEGESSHVREVKAVITLRSGKEVDLPTSKPEHELESEAEKEKREKIKGKKKGSKTIPSRRRRRTKRGVHDRQPSGEHCDKKMLGDLNESLGDLDEGLPEPSDLLATLPPLKMREEILPLFNGEET
ncbi:hypothetical protein CK203_113616 [Vitis vinifera]|uniref:Uncharacterized protein n=1 Tax=Vitis vinifera TaxID=29760 RepID=A0A438FF30_VITVI|nr:hypothetical protein CK203_113616 [Vitis vinifera]